MLGAQTASDRSSDQLQMSAGQQRELCVATLQSLPLTLSVQDARRIIGNKGLLRRWLRLGLETDLTIVDLGQIEKFVKKLELSVPRFSTEARQKLEECGWETVLVPLGLDCRHFLESRFISSYSASVLARGPKPTRAREVAWFPKDPISELTRGKTFAEQRQAVWNVSQIAQTLFGAKAIVPSAEEVLYLFSCRSRLGQVILASQIRVANHVDIQGQSLLLAWSGSPDGFELQTPRIGLVDVDYTVGTLGILSFLVPA